MSKYSEALENRKKVKFIKWKTHDADGSLHFEDVVPVSDVDVIEQALRIADRLGRIVNDKKVGIQAISNDMFQVGSTQDFVDVWPSEVGIIFQAMAAELIKEEENK